MKTCTGSIDTSTTLVITHRFPSSSGEPFLCAELPALQTLPGSLVFLPCSRFQDTPQIVPENLYSYCLARGKFKKVWDTFSFHNYASLFMQAVKKEQPLRLSSLARLAFACSCVAHYYSRLKRYIVDNKLQHKPLLIYTYWFNSATYAAWLLKKEFPHIQVISRAHLIDALSTEHPYNYMPLRKTCGDWVDMVLPCARTIFQELAHEGVRQEKMAVSYLGAFPAKSRREFTATPNHISILSCSFLVPVKRLWLLIDMLAAFARQQPEITIAWTHIGGGDALPELKEYARQQFSQCHNATAQFTGLLSPAAIQHFYATNDRDIFINISESEGLPVSIMEAISYGIPVIATAVGGTPEIVTPVVGRLLPKDFTEQEFSEAILDIKSRNSAAMREMITSFFDSNFNAYINYENFVNNICIERLNTSAQILAQQNQPCTMLEPNGQTNSPPQNGE